MCLGTGLLWPWSKCYLAMPLLSEHCICFAMPGLQDSFLDEGFILDKKIGVGQPHRITDAKVLIANTPMDTDKIKIYGARVRVDSMAKVSLWDDSSRCGCVASCSTCWHCLQSTAACPELLGTAPHGRGQWRRLQWCSWLVALRGNRAYNSRVAAAPGC